MPATQSVEPVATTALQQQVDFTSSSIATGERCGVPNNRGTQFSCKYELVRHRSLAYNVCISTVQLEAMRYNFVHIV